MVIKSPLKLSQGIVDC